MKPDPRTMPAMILYVFCIVMLIAASICSAQITIEGPSRVDVGREIILDVRGTPEPDDDAQWGKAFVWLRDLSLELDSPDDATAIVKAGFVLDVNLETGTVFPRLQAKAVPDAPGVYFVSVVYWPDRARAVHRFTAGPVAPPPPPVPDKTFAERLKPPADPATAKELIANYQQILSLWQAAPAVTDAITSGKPLWEPFRVTMRTITGPADLQAAITVLEGVK